MIYESLDNALNGKANKFKKECTKNPSHKIEKYNIYGSTSSVHVSEDFFLYIT